MSVRRAICALALLLLPFAATGRALPAQEGPRNELAPGDQQPAKPAAPTVRLVYQLPPRELAALVAREPGRKPDAIAAETVAVLQRRLGSSATVQLLGGTTFEVLAAGVPAAIAALRARIEQRGRLELRVVADERFRENNVAFDLTQEKQRLHEWLENGGREQVRADWRAIDRFNDDLEHGPVAKVPRADGKGSSNALRWCPHLVFSRVDNPTRWEHPYALDDRESGGVQPLAPSTFAVFDLQTDWNQGLVPGAMVAAASRTPEQRPFLLEFVAINLAEVAFTGADMDPNRVPASMSDEGTAAIACQLRPELCVAYANWSQKYIRRHSAIVVNGLVRSAPYFASRIPGHGQISGGFTLAEAEDLAACLRGGELELAPVLLREEPVAPAKAFPK
jgi:hypothetical protein